MNNSQIYVGLDIGTASIKVLVCENVKGKLEVVGVGSHPSGGLSHGAIVDIDKTAQAIKAAVEQAKSKSGVDIPLILFAISWWKSVFLLASSVAQINIALRSGSLAVIIF